MDTGKPELQRLLLVTFVTLQVSIPALAWAIRLATGDRVHIFGWQMYS
jgi:hypothetical protein